MGWENGMLQIMRINANKGKEPVCTSEFGGVVLNSYNTKKHRYEIKTCCLIKKKSEMQINSLTCFRGFVNSINYL